MNNRQLKMALINVYSMLINEPAKHRLQGIIGMIEENEIKVISEQAHSFLATYKNWVTHYSCPKTTKHFTISRDINDDWYWLGKSKLDVPPRYDAGCKIVRNEQVKKIELREEYFIERLYKKVKDEDIKSLVFDFYDNETVSINFCT